MSDVAPPQTGTVEQALARAETLLTRDPKTAALQAQAILQGAPAHPKALLILGAAHARQGDHAAARAILEPLARAQPRAAIVHFEYGKLLAELGDTHTAIQALTHAVTLNSHLPQAWRALADALFLAGRTAEADAAYARHLREAVHDPALMEAGDALVANDLPRAEHLLRAHLKRAPTDVAALRMLAEAGTRLGRYAAAETLLERCLELAPNFHAARYNYAVVLFRQNRATDALAEMRTLIAAEPRDPNYRLMLAACLATTGAYDESIALYADLLRISPNLPRLWSGYGHVLRTAGRRDDAIAAYRTILTLAPTMGEAWWSLANLKTGILDQSDIAQMQAALAAENLSNEDRLHLHYALGRTLEEAAAYEPAFTHYAEGARLRRPEVAYDPDATTAQIDRTIALATPAFFAARAGSGCPDPSPIFIIGLPRSGSTLIEQMLATHSMVEGTMELPELANVARELTPNRNYPDCLDELPIDRLAAWGERYLERTRPYRRTSRPYFIDKMPNNWVHAPLIHLILPNAKIIDARRHPMASCFSTFKQHFARGQNYSYDLKELGRYFKDYARLMAALDQALPARIHRVQYETMVENTEAELRRLLAYCTLPYDPACLNFHQNPRPVRTASSEQVRRPIFREGLDHWRHFEPWLVELEQALWSTP